MTAPAMVIAGAGVLHRSLMPNPDTLEGGEEVYVLNVYTEPEHRRRGLARQLMQAILAWCQARGGDRATSLSGRRACLCRPKLEPLHARVRGGGDVGDAEPVESRGRRGVVSNHPY